MSTKTHTTKQELISAIIENRTALLHAASQLSLEARDTAFLDVWSVVDLIARGHPIRGMYKPSGLNAKGDCHINYHVK